jgi:hypothetical protein
MYKGETWFYSWHSACNKQINQDRNLAGRPAGKAGHFICLLGGRYAETDG